jgi:hypothetical protein
VALVVTGLVFAACGGASMSGPSDERPPLATQTEAGGFVPDGQTLERCARSDVRCHQQALGNIAYRTGPDTALAVLSGLLEENVPAIRSGCHTMTHYIGAAAILRYRGNVTKAFGLGSSVCGAGYYHGLTSFAFRDSRTEKQLVRKVRDVCSMRGVYLTDFLMYQCIHGLGHGLMNYSANELPWALRMCGRLRADASKMSCAAGAFMQNFIEPNSLSPSPSKYVRGDDLLYPCDVVEELWKSACYTNVTYHILDVTRSWTATAKVCRMAQDPWRRLCFQSYGRDAAVSASYMPGPTHRLCIITRMDMAECVLGAVRTIANNDGDGARASQFCRLVPSQHRGLCFFGAGSVLRTLGHDRAWFERTCRSLSRRYSSACQGVFDERERALVTPIPSM